MTNPLAQLQSKGQSVWYDNIDRSQLASGQFKRMLDEDGVLGVTANPTIFEKSISSGHAYDEQISQLINEGKSTNEIYEAIVIQDIRTVADLLRPIYEHQTGKMDMSALKFRLNWQTTQKAQLLKRHVSGRWLIVPI